MRELLATSASTAGAGIVLQNITVEFPGVRALDGVNLELRPGEVLGLVGENGAGKSTLIKVLGGVHPAGHYRGEVTVDGSRRRFRTTADARAAGIAVVHQELSLVPEMTVADNLLLGREPGHLGLVDHVQLIADARRLLAAVAGDAPTAMIDPETPVARLGVGLQQVVEIARALGERARFVVLDEPTAALTDQEKALLFQLIATHRADGTAFVYISHHLDEVFEVCDRIAVLRDGKLIGHRDAAATDADEIVGMMTGKELGSLSIAHACEPGATVLEVEQLSVSHPTLPQRKVIDELSFSVRAGEVVALAGAMGAGRTALLSTLFGLARGRVSGRVCIDGTEALARSPRHAIANKLALVPEDRKEAGLVLGMSVRHNITLASLTELVVDGVLDERTAQDSSIELRVKTASLDVEVGTLSGGNQQKVALAKWLLTKPRVLLLDEPTRGVDVGAKAEIYRLIRTLVADGMAVLVASSDLPEIQLLADRVLVLRDGRLAGELSRAEATQEAIMQLSVGRL